MKACDLMCEDLMATSNLARMGSNTEAGAPTEAETKGIGSTSLWDNEW